MKAWRLQACPRNALTGKKVKGANRRDKANDGLLFLRNVVGTPPLLERLFSLGDLPRIAEKHLKRMAEEREAKLKRRAKG